jgi:ABC-type branched-subunit amino acid transport system permease subunit
VADYLVFALLGLASGAIAAFLGLGILVGYRGSGVVNFAQGAVAMYVAYVYYGVRTEGKYPLPFPGLPGYITLGSASGMAAAVAVPVALATAVVLGLLMHFLVFRPLRSAPPLAKVAASIGLLILFPSVIAFRFGTNTVSVPGVLPQSTAFSISGDALPWNQVILTALVVAMAAGLWALFRYTRFGLSVCGAAENEKGAILLGYSPDRQAGLNWVLASTLAGLGGILVAPIINLTPTNFTLLIIPALAAVLVARFSSFGVMAGAALVIGMVQSELDNLPSKVTWWPSTGTDQLFPFLVIVVVMFVVGKSLPSRGAVNEGRLPFAAPTRPRLVLPGTAVALTVVALYTLTAGYRLALVNSIVGALVCLSLVVVTGYVGQIALCQMTLAGVAAYLLASFAQHEGIPFPLAPLLACAGAMVVGLVIAIPALRIRGVSLAVITLGAGWAIEEFFFTNPKYTGGSSGTNIPAMHFFGASLPFSKGSDIAQPAFGLFALGVLVVVAIGVSNLRRSRTGRRFLALRANERSAAAAGVNVNRMKFLAFGFAAFIAGLAGVMVAYQQTLLSEPSFDILVSVSFLAVAYIGGISSVSGGLIGGALGSGGIFFYFLLQMLFKHSANGLQFEDIISGVGLILTAILNPEGIAGAMRVTRETLAKRLRPPGVVVLAADPPAPPPGPVAPPSGSAPEAVTVGAGMHKRR